MKELHPEHIFVSADMPTMPDTGRETWYRSWIGVRDQIKENAAEGNLTKSVVLDRDILETIVSGNYLVWWEIVNKIKALDKSELYRALHPDFKFYFMFQPSPAFLRGVALEKFYEERRIHLGKLHVNRQQQS